MTSQLSDNKTLDKDRLAKIWELKEDPLAYQIIKMFSVCRFIIPLNLIWEELNQISQDDVNATVAQLLELGVITHIGSLVIDKGQYFKVDRNPMLCPSCELVHLLLDPSF